MTLNPLNQLKASISRAAPLYLILYLSYLIVFLLQRAKTRFRLLLGLGIGYGELENYVDVVRLIM
jgi:hypothetical protein